MATSPVAGAKATALVGATGLVGSHILEILLRLPQVSSVSTLSRRPPTVDDPHSRLHPIVETDSKKWASHLESDVSTPDIFFSGLGTTRGAAGGLAGQRKIDYDLNVELAQAAKKSGVAVYVLISAAGSSSTSRFAYSKMKAELEESIAAMGFDKAVFIRPGFLIGSRPHMKFGESGAQAVANVLGSISGGRFKDAWAQDADVVARAAVRAGLMASTGQAPDGKIWNVGQADIVRLGHSDQ